MALAAVEAVGEAVVDAPDPRAVVARRWRPEVVPAEQPVGLGDGHGRQCLVLGDQRLDIQVAAKDEDIPLSAAGAGKELCGLHV
ncbi:MAG: hypothetical protein KDA22_08420 [Phycisphaerales bacterium]|nr:hypothetical protein [Phycisphaerales bacterium]